MPDESRAGSQKREVTLRRSHLSARYERQSRRHRRFKRGERERETGEEFAGAAVATYLLHEACLALGESDLPTALVLDVGDADLPPASCAGLRILSWPRRHRHQRTSSALLHWDSCDDTEGSLTPTSLVRSVAEEETLLAHNSTQCPQDNNRDIGSRKGCASDALNAVFAPKK